MIKEHYSPRCNLIKPVVYNNCVIVQHMNDSKLIETQIKIPFDDLEYVYFLDMILGGNGWLVEGCYSMSNISNKLKLSFLHAN